MVGGLADPVAVDRAVDDHLVIVPRTPSGPAVDRPQPRCRYARPMRSWSSPEVPVARTISASGRARPSSVHDTSPAGAAPSIPSQHGAHVRLRHHAVRRDPHGSRRDLPGLRPAAARLARPRPRRHLHAERHRRRRPAARARDRDRRRLGRAGRARDAAVPRGHDRAAHHPAGALHRRGRVDRPGRRPRGTPAGGRRRLHASTTTSTSTCTPIPASASSRASTRQTMLRIFPERGGDPDRAGQEAPARLPAVAGRASRRAAVGHAPGPWPSRLAHRVRGDRAAPPRHGLRRAGRRLRPGLPAPRDVRLRGRPSPPTSRSRSAYVHAGMVGYEGEKMSKSKGNLVLVSKLRAAGHDPMAIRLALLAHHYRSDWEWFGDEIDGAEERLARWRDAVTRSLAPSGDALLEQIRAAHDQRPGRARPRWPRSTRGRPTTPPRTRRPAAPHAPRSTRCSASHSDPGAGTPRSAGSRVRSSGPCGSRGSAGCADAPARRRSVRRTGARGRRTRRGRTSCATCPARCVPRSAATCRGSCLPAHGAQHPGRCERSARTRRHRCRRSPPAARRCRRASGRRPRRCRCVMPVGREVEDADRPIGISRVGRVGQVEPRVAAARPGRGSW